MAISKNSSTLRNAAVFIRSLDADLAAQLLARLSPSEARKLREALRDLGPVDDDDIASVAVAIRNPVTKPEVHGTNESAVELELNHDCKGRDRSEGTHARNPGRRTNSQLADLEQLTASGANLTSPFNSLIETDIETLGEFLKCEHPQTIAVVFSYLPPNKAAEALAMLPEDRQAEVIHRLSELRDADPSTLEVVEQSLETWLLEKRHEQQRRMDRMSIVKSILAASQNGTRQTIFASLRERDRLLADQIESQLAPRCDNDVNLRRDSESSRINSRIANRDCDNSRQVRLKVNKCESRIASQAQTRVKHQVPSRTDWDIECLMRSTDLQLKAIVDRVDPHVLHCALTSASDALLDRICKFLPREQRKQIQHGLRSLGPITLRDVEVARQIVSECASRLGTFDSERPLVWAA